MYAEWMRNFDLSLTPEEIKEYEERHKKKATRRKTKSKDQNVLSIPMFPIEIKGGLSMEDGLYDLHDRITSLICFSDYDSDQQDEMLEYIQTLEDNSLFLRALINSGVDNWECYDEAIELYNNCKEAEENEGN